MAAEDVDVTTAPVPQATGSTLPGLAADLADIAPAPSAEDALLEANFGARGAQQYRDLRAAGQSQGTPPAAPAPTSPLDALVGGGASAPAPTPAYNQPSELAVGGIANALRSFGNPQMAAQQQQAQQKQILAATQAKQAASIELFSLIPTAFKQFAGRPDLAAAFLQNEAQQRGIPLTAPIAMYLNQKIVDGQLTLEDIENKMKGADLNTMQRYGTSLTEWSNVIKSQAETSKAIAEAAAAPAAANQAAQKKALEIANAIRTAQRPPTQNEIETLTAAKLEAYQVPVPGSPGNLMWSTRPKGTGAGAGVVDPSKLAEGSTRNLREQQFHKAAKEKLQQEVTEGKRQAYGEVDIANEVERMRATAEGQKTHAVKTAGLVAEAKTTAARGMELLNTMDDAVKQYGLAKGPVAAKTVQPLRMLWDWATSDPTYSVLSAFPATMSNVARALGEKGVLTDRDLERVGKAIVPRTGDTEGAYMARVKFVREAMRRSQAALEQAEKSGELKKVDLSDVTFDGDPLPTEGARDVSALAAAPTAAGAPAGAGGEPARVQTPADAANLPPGTRFVTPDGQIRVRK